MQNEPRRLKLVTLQDDANGQKWGIAEVIPGFSFDDPRQAVDMIDRIEGRKPVANAG